MPKIQTDIPAAPIPAADLGAGLVKVSAVGAEFAPAQKILDDMQKEALDIERFRQYNDLSTSGLQEISTQYQTMLQSGNLDPKTFQTQAQTAADKIANGAADPTIKIKVAVDLRRLIVTKTNDLIAERYKRYVDSQQAYILDDLEARAITHGEQIATLHPNDRLIEENISTGLANVDAAVYRGFIPADVGAKMKSAWKSRLVENGVRLEMMGDPFGVAQKLEDPKSYPGLHEEKRLTLMERAIQQSTHLATVREQAEKEAERRQTKAWETNVAGAMADILAGKIKSPLQITGQIGTSWNGQQAQELIRFWDAKTADGEGKVKNDPKALLFLNDRFFDIGRSGAPTDKDVTGLFGEIRQLAADQKIKPDKAWEYTQKLLSFEKSVFNRPDFQRAAEILKASIITKSEFSPDFNHEQKRTWAVYHAQLQEAVEKGEHPYAALKRLGGEVFGKVKKAEIEGISAAWKGNLGDNRPTFLPGTLEGLTSKDVGEAIARTAQAIADKSYPPLARKKDGARIAARHLALLSSLQASLQTLENAQAEIESLAK